MISLIEAFKREFISELSGTRKMLSIIPDDKLLWKAHPKSMDINTLALHIAELPIMFEMVLNHDKWDFYNSPYPSVPCDSTLSIVKRFDECSEIAIAAFDKADNAALEEKWKMVAGEATYIESEKWEAVRHTFGQIIHHRAQLGVNLRLLDIPIPGVYGPSADEM